MDDRDPVWDAIKEHAKSKFDADRAKFLGEAQANNDGKKELD